MSMVWNTAASVVHKALLLEQLPLVFTLFVTVIFVLIVLKKHTSRSSALRGVPPGKFGWPLIGETLDFLGCQRRGAPHEFFHSRMKKYGNVFSTSLVGHPTVAFCSPEGHRFLFTNENKLVVLSWPKSVSKILGKSLNNTSGDDAKRLRRMLMTFLRPEGLQKFVGRVDSLTKRQMAEYWMGKDEVTVLPLIKHYAFTLACDLFASITDPDDVQRLSSNFKVLQKGLLQIPIDLPGTRHNKAKHAANAIRKQLDDVLRKRRIALQEAKASPEQDLFSFLLSHVDERGEKESLTDEEVKDNFILLLFAGHDSTTATITGLLKFLAENPDCYDRVLKEQLEIANSKEEGQLLQWQDLQKMKYSWRAAQETLRLSPPAQGGFRKSIKDFTYEGYKVPKGWQMVWSVSSTHVKPEYFRDPEKFDPSRFEEAVPPPYTYVPFGGGLRTCPGSEYARMEILIFLHNIVKNFKWELVNPAEKVIIDPIPFPANGLPVRLIPHSI